MSDEMPSQAPARRTSRWFALGILSVVAVLAIATIVLISVSRLSNTTASNGQDMSDLNRGLIGAGFGNTAPKQTALGQGPVADIAINLVSQAFSFTPGDFDKQVAAAEASMGASMRQQYVSTIQGQQLQTAINEGIIVTTSLLHLNNDPKQVGLIGVESVTATHGKFLMYMQRQATTKGSTQAQATVFLLEVTVDKIGNTWILSDVKTI